ncbi:MAG: BON domain-containing protein [Candidatus Acidiferrum sp.]|jgi:hyperosmotically inducible protein
MNRNRMILRMVTLGSTLALGTALVALPSVHPGAQQTTPDNTKMNQGDAEQSATTADAQKMNPADRELTRKIRSSIYKDKALSTYAHNIKIISQNGTVTLKGPVRSDDEKAAIDAKATAIAGAGNVTDQLTVVPPKS